MHLTFTKWETISYKFNKYTPESLITETYITSKVLLLCNINGT